MGAIIKHIALLGATYATWGVITVCDPHLVSDGAAKDSDILKLVKGCSDIALMGCKVCFLVPACIVEGIYHTIKKN